MDKNDLLQRLEHETGVFKNTKIKEAFTDVDREDFVDEDYKVEAYEDYALPIGFGQSISQPTTLAFMLELLDVQDGERVLDVGYGSGFSTALLGHMTGSEGLVYALEVVPELAAKGKRNIEKYNQGQIHMLPVTEKNVLFDLPQFDRILVNADVKEIPQDIISMLKVGGTVIVPIEGSLYKIKKTELGLEEEARFPGFSFVDYVNM